MSLRRRPAHAPGSPRPLLVLVLLVVAAGIAPRLLALWGVSHTAVHQFEDMPHHLMLLDVISKRRFLPELQRDPSLEPFSLYNEQRNSHLRAQWPPGIQHLASPLARVFGPASIWTVQLTNLLFSLLLALGVVGLGRALDDLRMGLWAAAVTLLCPALVASSWYFSMDYPLVAMVTVGLLLLWHTRGFARLPACLALAVWSVLGMLIKPSYAIYLLGPSVYFAASGVWRAMGICRLWAVCRAAAALALALALYSLLSEPSWRELWGTASDHLVQHGLVGAMPPWSSEWTLCNLKFAVVNMPFPLLLLAAPGLLLLHLRRAGRAGRFLSICLWCGYIALTLASNKMERYLQPLYPLLCLLGPWWICTWLPPRWRPAALGAAVALAGGTLCYTHLIRPTPWLPAEYAAIRRDGGEPQQGSAFHPLRYELLMPGRAFFDDLRRRRWDPDCELTPLLQQVASWTAALPGRRPLGLLYYQREQVNQMFPSPHHPPLKLMAGLLQTVRERYLVIHDPLPQNRLPEPLRRLPRVLVLHHPTEDPLRHEAGLTRLSYRAMQIRCKNGLHPLSLSLVRAK